MILALVTVVPQFISTLLFIGTSVSDDFINLALTIGLLLLTIFILFLILRYCVFRTDLIIDKLHLDKNFPEEKFELNIHRSTVLTIAVIVIGGLVLIDSVPELCRHIFSYAQEKNMRFIENPDGGWMIFYAVKTLIGFFMVTSSRLIVNFIEQKRKG